MGLNKRSFGLDQGILNRPCDIGWEHGSGIHRSRHRLLPGFQHLVHLPSCIVIHQSICLHERRIELPAEEECIWRTDILDDGIEDIKSR
jgi:hypothetical protein